MTNINFKNLYFSFQGRIDRQKFWIGMGGIFAASAVVQASVFVAVNSSDAELVGLLASFLFFIPTMAVCAKRNRDRGQSMFWLLVLTLPIAGLIWMVIDLGMRPARDSVQPHNETQAIAA